MRETLVAPEPVLGSLRGLAWHHFEAAWAPRLGTAAFDALLRDAAAPERSRLDAFATSSLGPFVRALSLLDQRHGRGDGALLREAGREAAQAWGRSYRHLARQVRGDPRRTLRLLCEEILPWLLDARNVARVEDTGPQGALVRVDSPLPAAYVHGMLEGFLALAGADGARVAPEGGRFALTWEATTARRAPKGAALLQALRPRWLAVALIPSLLGAALAWRDGFLSAPHLGLTLLGIALFQVGANLANDWFDHRSRADEANHTPTPFSGGSRVIQQGLLSPRAVLGLAVAALAGGIAVGLALMLALPGAALHILGLGLLGFALGLAYTAPPLHLAHRGLGEVAVGLGFGPLIVAGTYLVQRAAAGGGLGVSAEALAFSLPLGALVAAVLYINEFPDRPWDAAAGKRTLVVRLSGKRAVQGYGALLALAYLSLVAAAAAFAAWPALLALFTAPLAWKAWRHLQQHHDQPYRLVPANATTVLLHLATGLLLVGGLVLGRLALPGV